MIKNVVIRETLERVVPIESRELISDEEALRIAETMYKDEKVVLTADDLKSVDFLILSTSDSGQETAAEGGVLNE